MKGRGGILFCLLVILIAGSSIVFEDGSVDAADPKAYFTYSPKDPEVDEPVTFNASLSSGEGLQYSWDFGGGDVKTGMIVNHTFEKYGSHQVTLIVTNSTGGIDLHSRLIHIDHEYDEMPAIATFIFLIAYFLFYFLFIFSFVLFYALNAIIGGVLGYRVYQRGKENGQIEVAKPYIIAHLIAGGVSIFMPYLCLPSVIAHIVIYFKFKGRMREMGIDISKKMEEKKTVPPKVLHKPPM